MGPVKRSAEEVFISLREEPKNEKVKKARLANLSDAMRSLTIQCFSTQPDFLIIPPTYYRTTDEQLIEHARQFCRLDTFTVGQAKFLTDYGVYSVLKHARDFLRVFDVSVCPQITDRTLYALADCSKLEEVSLVDCPRVTDSGILALAKRCHNLTKLNLDWCPLVTSRGFLSISRLCPHLREFSAIATKNINFLSFIVLLKKCKKITSLDLYGCMMVNDSWLTVISTLLPRITLLDVQQTSVTQKGARNFMKKHPRCVLYTT